jgi:hypothetical protein
MILKRYLSLGEVDFRPRLRHFFGVARDLFENRDIFTRRLFDTVPENLSAAISWLTFSRVVFAMRSGIEND